MKIVMILSVLILFVACTANSEEKLPEGVEITETNLWTPFVDVLRIRETPDLNGKVIATIKLGEQVEYAGETSTNQSTIDFNGEKITDSWIKVKMKDGKIGWGWKGFLYRLVKYYDKYLLVSMYVPIEQQWCSDQWTNYRTGYEREEQFKHHSQINIHIERTDRNKYTYEEIDSIKILNGKDAMSLYIDSVEFPNLRYNPSDKRNGYIILLKGLYFDNTALHIWISVNEYSLVKNLTSFEITNPQELPNKKISENKIFYNIQKGNGTYNSTKWYNSVWIICNSINFEKK